MLDDDVTVNPSFDPNDYLWYDHLSTAIKELQSKKLDIDRAWLYYDGDHPRVWLTDKLRETFKDLADQFSENWCGLVIDKPIDRLSITGWIGDQALDERDHDTEQIEDTHAAMADALAEDNDLMLEQSEVYRHVRVAGEAYLFVWQDEDKETGIDISLNDARHVWWPSTSHRNKPDRVVKVWPDDEEGKWRATVYYSEVVIRLSGPKINATQVMPNARYFTIDEDDPGGPHGFEQVPVIRFAMRRKRQSVLKPIIPIQDRINKLVANQMVAAEFGAWRARAILTEQDIDDDDLRLRPNRVLKLHPGGGQDGMAPTSIWEGSATELSNYDNSINEQIDKLFTIATLPRHLRVNPGTPPSGAAIEADEGPFTEMIEQMQEVMSACWKDLMALVNIEVTPQWRSPRVRSDVDEANTVKVFKEAGVPLEAALKKYANWSDEDIEDMHQIPASMGEVTNALQNLSTGVALGGVDPNQAQLISQQLLGGGNNAQRNGKATAQKNGNAKA